MTTPTNPLDSLLPLIRPEARELHLNVALVEVAEPALLAELASDPRIRRYLLGRLTDTIALVDPGQAKELEAALVDAGHTPKVVKGDGK